jgi:DNA-binding response OmpR family regulator
MEKTILIADDDAMVQALMRRILGGAYRLISALNGAQAVELCRAQQPDLVLLDLTMPVKNGGDVLRDIRQNAGTRSIPVIILSGDGDIGSRVSGIDNGADDFIAKPFLPEDLKARITRLIR